MQTILQFLGLFFLLILSFFGANYMLKGDIIISGSISILLVIVVFFLVEFLKKRKVEITKSKFSPTSILLWAIFLIVCIPIGILIIHALNAEINAKKDLQNYAKELVAKNQEVVSLFQSENKQYVEETYLYVSNALDTYTNSPKKSIKDSIKSTLGTKRFGITDFSQITKSNFLNKANALQSALEIRSQAVLDSVQERSKSVINNNFYLVENWSRLRVVNAIQELELLLDKNLNQLNRFLTDENYKTDVFVTSSADTETILRVSKIDNDQLEIQKITVNLSSFSALWNQYRPYWLVIPTLVFFFFLLLPYLLERTAGDYLTPEETESDEEGIEI